MSVFDLPKIEEHQLERIHISGERLLHADRMLTELDLITPTVRAFIDQSADALIVQLQGYVWAKAADEQKVTMTVAKPASWWQHFKQDYFPNWAVKLWPVKVVHLSNTYTFKTKIAYPTLKLAGHQGVLKTFVTRELE